MLPRPKTAEPSDNIATGEATSSEERQSTFTTMMKIALETAIK